ncbi:MAG: hypothetical protein MR765_02125 [Tenericutes bacterium]|nr:hypothetical protein [Mycoplasmatota bacterium]
MSKFGYIKLQDNIMLIGAKSNTSDYLMEQVKFASLDNHKVLLIDYETTNDILENKQYKYLNKESIAKVFDKNYVIEKLEETIIKTKPEYVYINTLSLIPTLENVNDDDKIKYIIKTLNGLANKYSVKFLIIDRYLTDEKIYLTPTYKNINSIWILQENNMNRIK